ncbi:MAG: hypothetical protein RL367_473, partial [Pseudomonadota bacterium]
MKNLVWIAVATALCGSAATAQRGERIGRDCRREVLHLCGLGGGREAIRACLIRNYAKLSPDCLQRLIALRTGGAAMQPT